MQPAHDVDLLDLPADLRSRSAGDVHLSCVDHLERAVRASGVMVDHDALARLLAEQVGPAGVEPEGLIGAEADRREDRDLGGQQQTDPPRHGTPVATREPRPPPHRADEQQHREEDRECQHLVARETHGLFLPALSGR